MTTAQQLFKRHHLISFSNVVHIKKVFNFSSINSNTLINYPKLSIICMDIFIANIMYSK